VLVLRLQTDCMGHGSMVASVAATSNGVAPGALLGSYRVFGCSGYAVDDIIIEAIDRAVQDGCDIINLSLASGSGFASTVGGQCLFKSELGWHQQHVGRGR
jgi:subtilisin family serine protease